MADIIVVIILVILVGGAVAYIVKSKRSGVKCIGCPAGGSCPSSRKLPKKKLRGSVIGKRTIRISGMSCQNCVNSVMKALNEIDGVTANVSLSGSSATVSYDRMVEDAQLKEAVEKAGFRVTDIS